MAVNKVVINNEVKLDLTGDSVSPADVVAGVLFHMSSGVQATGTLRVQTYRYGNSNPVDTLGDDGDLFLVMG